MREIREEVDQEWVVLMSEAKNLGISKEEIQYFIEMNSLKAKTS